MNSLLIVLILSIVSIVVSFVPQQSNIYKYSRLNMEMGLTLYGSPQTRSPLVNWYLIEKKIPFTQKPPRPNPNLFGQIPFLTDSNGVEIFESGAILLYLADAYGGADTAVKRAQYTKWVVWANAELDGMCFGKGMSGTVLDKASRGLDILENYLNDKNWLVNNEFSVADVAVGAYLNYVPIFFGNVNPTSRPNIVQYMKRCAERPAFAEAFGEEHQQVILRKTESWSKSGGGGGGGFKLW